MHAWFMKRGGCWMWMANFCCVRKRWLLLRNWHSIGFGYGFLFQTQCKGMF